MPRATGDARSRAGLSISEVLDDVVTLLGSGTNVVTTVTDFFARGHRRLGDEGLRRIRTACERGGSSLYATGSDPGFMTEMLPFALLSVQRKVESVEITEFGDLSHRPSPHMVFEQMGFGRHIAEFDPGSVGGAPAQRVGATAVHACRSAGFTVDGSAARGDVAAAWRDLSIVAGDLEAGTVGAQCFIISARSAGVDVVRLVQYAYVTLDVEPAWDLRPTGWRVQVHGDAPFDAGFALPVPPKEIGSFVPAYNANLPVNAIPYLCAAPPGILTTEDLPHILPRGPRRAVPA